MTKYILLFSLTLSTFAWAQSHDYRFAPGFEAVFSNPGSAEYSDSEDILDMVVRGEVIPTNKSSKRNQVNQKPGTQIIVIEQTLNEDGVYEITRVSAGEQPISAQPPRENSPCRGEDDRDACRPRGRY